jgi:hypothetical protein
VNIDFSYLTFLVAFMTLFVFHESFLLCFIEHYIVSLRFWLYSWWTLISGNYCHNKVLSAREISLYPQFSPSRFISLCFQSITNRSYLCIFVCTLELKENPNMSFAALDSIATLLKQDFFVDESFHFSQALGGSLRRDALSKCILYQIWISNHMEVMGQCIHVGNGLNSFVGD